MSSGLPANNGVAYLLCFVASVFFTRNGCFLRDRNYFVVIALFGLDIAGLGGAVVDNIRPASSVWQALNCAPLIMFRDVHLVMGVSWLAAASANLSYSRATRSSLNFCLSLIQRRSASAAVAAARSRQYFALNSDIRFFLMSCVTRPRALVADGSLSAPAFVGTDLLSGN